MSCQAGVFLSHASERGYGPIDYELHMPDKWFQEAFAKKRGKCGVPEDLMFKTKSQLALDMIHKAVASGKFRHERVGCDCAFGHDGDFLQGWPKEVKCFADVPFNTQVLRERPKMIVPEYKGRGRKPHPAPDAKPVTVKEAVDMDDAPWSGVVLGIGARGPLITRDKRLKVVESRDGKPGKDVWLCARMMDDGEAKILPVQRAHGRPDRSRPRSGYDAMVD